MLTVKKIVVTAGIEIEKIVDTAIPLDWAIISSVGGWHILHGDDHVFVKWETIQKVWNRASKDWFEKEAS